MQWQAAIDFVHSAPVEDVIADFEGIDATVVNILQRYRVGALPQQAVCTASTGCSART